MELLDVGAQAKAARKARALTQREVAAISGVSRARLDALENGRPSDIGFRNVVRILNALGLDLQIVPGKARRPTLDDLMREEQEVRASRLERG